MLNTTMTLVLTLSLGQYPVTNVNNGNAIQGAIEYAPQQNGMVDPGLPGYGAGEGPGGHFSAGLTGASEDELYPYDGQEPWIHGYWQEIPAYGGFGAYRPYNYKHALAQSQASGGWGMSPKMPYSQQFWHRYQQRAEMLRQAPQLPAAAATSFNGQPAQNIVQLQAPYYPQRIQPVAGSYPVRSRPAPRAQSRKSSGFAQRLEQTKKQVATKQQKRSLFPSMFSRRK